MGGSGNETLDLAVEAAAIPEDVIRLALATGDRELINWRPETRPSE